MKTRRRFLLRGCFLVLMSKPAAILAVPLHPLLEIDPKESPAEAVGKAPVTLASADTIWVADWSFDVAGGGCTDAGWLRYDNRILNDGSNYWSSGTQFSGTGGIAGKAAILSKHDLTWVRDGYGNSWDYSIILRYQGAGATLGFDYLSDSEPGFDFVTVEADSAGASESRVDYTVAPGDGPAAYRAQLLSVDGVHNATVASLALPDFTVPAMVHEVYIRFTSDAGYSDEDGLYPTTWNAGLAVDNIVVTGVLSYTEDFEGSLGSDVTLANTAPGTPFGEWARLYPHVTDNSTCTENSTCAWLWSDPGLPAYSPGMAFGPGGAVVRNWLDDVIVSPWVSLIGVPKPAYPLLSYRRFPGNDFGRGRIVQNWSVRSIVRIDNTDTSTPGDSVDLIGGWLHEANWNSLTSFAWETRTTDITNYVDPNAMAIQVRFRVSDWQYISGAPPPATFDPGPGPYLDHVRVGLRSEPGPRISTDGWNLAQDTFAGIPQGDPCRPGHDYYVPTLDRFGTCDFSRGSDIGCGFCNPTCVQYSVHCDSIQLYVDDLSGTGIANVWLYGAIVAGPHAGKAPPPWTVEPSGFFRVPVRRGLDCWGTDNGGYTADLDDDYFRGGDVLLYVLTASDNAGGFSSYPPGLTSEPASIEQAESVTGGLLEVSFLPRIDWDPAYLARIAADPNGKLTPSPAEIANSTQHSCILYVSQLNNVARSGRANRSAFLRTLDRLGYADLCDVYDQNYWGNSVSNNQLAGRAKVQQATGYALIVQDCGRFASHTTLPIGGAVEGFYPQTQWYRDWLAAGASGEAGRATLWLIGNDIPTVASWYSNPLVFGDMGATLLSESQPAGVHPEVLGQSLYTWADGTISDFTSDAFRLLGKYCPATFTNDGMGASGTAVVTHRYEPGTTPGEGAVVANSNATGHWNTILASLTWEEIVDPEGAVPGTPADVFAAHILAAVLPPDCQATVDPTDIARSGDLPSATRLNGNVPNPFNPVTTIRFDLAKSGRVTLRVYDVAGRHVRTLVDGWQEAGWSHRATWNGLDQSGHRVASGLYLYRLNAPGFTSTRKMILLK